jgi:hypothetical protein
LTHIVLIDVEVRHLDDSELVYLKLERLSSTTKTRATGEGSMLLLLQERLRRKIDTSRQTLRRTQRVASRIVAESGTEWRRALLSTGRAARRRRSGPRTTLRITARGTSLV